MPNYTPGGMWTGGMNAQENGNNQTAQNAGANGFGNYTGYGVGGMNAQQGASLTEGGVKAGLANQAANHAANAANQGAGIDLTKGHQQGAFQILNTLLNQGYIDPAQRDAAMAHFQTVMGNAGQARNQFNQNFNPAMQNALDFTQTGGISDLDFNALMGDYEALKGRYNQAADTGNLSKEEYEQILSSKRQDMMDMGRSAAESTFNKSNSSGMPFAASAILAQNARDTGAGLASERASLDKYQADSRAQARDAIRATLGQEGDTRMKRADNKLGGLNASTGLLGQLGGFLEGILGIEGGLAGNMAELETKTKPSGTQDIVNSLLEDIGQITDVEDGSIKTAYGNASSPKGKNKTTTSKMGGTTSSGGSRFSRAAMPSRGA